MTISGLNILIAHGSDDVRANLIDAVNDSHTITAACGTVAEMKRAAIERRPDLLITGIWFPDGDGIDTAIELGREHPLPCVISTAERSLELVEKAMEDHVMAYLIEPVSAEELHAAIIVAWSRFEQFRDLESQVDDLKTALEHRKTIERAKGLLMATRSMSESEAFSNLRRRAQDRRIRMVDIASEILADHTTNQPDSAETAD